MIAAILLPFGATGLATASLVLPRGIVADQLLLSLARTVFPCGRAPRAGHATLECLALGAVSFWAALGLCIPTAVPPRADLQERLKSRPHFLTIGMFGCGILAGAWGLLCMRYGGPDDGPDPTPDPRFDVGVGVMMPTTAGLLIGIGLIYVVAYVWPQRSPN